MDAELPATDPQPTPPEDTQGITPSSPVPITPRPFKHGRKRLYVTILVTMLVIGVGFGIYHFTAKHTPVANTSIKTTTTIKSTTSATTASIQGLQLNTSKNYGNKYANGVLPVGDGHYTTSAPKVGYVYACSQYAQSLTSGQGGAQSRGPWFTDNNTEYNINQKLHVQGSVMWSASFSNTISGGTRTISTNDLPSQPTGIFPIETTDPAYAYDHNPNTIKTQDLVYSLSSNPTYGSPNCMGGEVGIMLTGIALFNAFDAGGRDAGAWEIQDSCDGHPQTDGIYHYHTLSSCIKDVSVHTVIGFALDGFPITGPDIGPNNILTTDDLDECHGIVSQITLDGKSVTMYHYVMTEDFPYSVSCFRSTAIQPPDLAQSANKQQQGPPQPPR